MFEKIKYKKVKNTKNKNNFKYILIISQIEEKIKLREDY